MVGGYRRADEEYVGRVRGHRRNCSNKVSTQLDGAIEEKVTHIHAYRHTGIHATRDRNEISTMHGVGTNTDII